MPPTHRPSPDHGLPALGLVCTLLSGLTAIVCVLVSWSLLASALSADRFWLFFILCAGLTRTGFHLRVAGRLRDRSPDAPQAVIAYLACAALTTAAFVVALTKLGALTELGAQFGFCALWMAWPLTLCGLITRPPVRDVLALAATERAAGITEASALAPPDRSVEGTGVLMTTLAATGLTALLALGADALFTSATAKTPLTLAAPGSESKAFLIILLMTLAVRGALHLRLGLAAIRGLSPEGLYQGLTPYLWASVASGVALLGLIFLMAGGRLSPELLGLGLLTIALALFWPMALRRLSLDALVDADGNPRPARAHGPAPDRGLSALGYLLIALGTTKLALAVFESTWTPDSTRAASESGAGTLVLAALAGALSVWAGLEHLRLGVWRRWATLAFGAASIAPELDGFADGLSQGPAHWPQLIVAVAFPVVVVIVSLTRPAPLDESTPPHGIPARAD